MNGCSNNSIELLGLVPIPSHLKIQDGTIELNGEIRLRYQQNDVELSKI